MFSPLAFETLGGPGEAATAIIKKMCERLEQVTATKVASIQFKQQLSLSM